MIHLIGAPIENGVNSTSQVEQEIHVDHLLVFDEYEHGGRPLWRSVNTESTQVRVYGLDRWSDGTSLYQEERNAAVQTYAGPAWKYHSHGVEDQGIAVYMPRSEEDLHWLCKCAWRWLELAVITPCEITESQWNIVARGKEELRPLRFLRSAHICEAIGVPWICILCLYSYHVTLSVISAQSADVARLVAAAGQEMSQFKVISLDNAIAFEQDNWERNYRQFDRREKQHAPSQKAEEA